MKRFGNNPGRTRRPGAPVPNTAPTYSLTGDIITDLGTADAALITLQNMFLDRQNSGAQSVHVYTRQIGKICNEFFIPLDKENQLTTATAAQFEQTAADIMALTEAGAESNNVNLVLASIRERRGAIENAETNLDVMTLLVKTWESAKRLDNKAILIPVN